MTLHKTIDALLLGVVSVYSPLTSIANHKDKVASTDSAPAFTTLHSAAESADMQATPDSAIMITTHQIVAESGDADKVSTLVTADSTITSLHSAARSGNFDKVKELLENDKYSVNCTDSSGQTPLHCACEKGNLDIVRALVSEFQADLTIQDTDGRTALMLAAGSGDDEIGNVLIAQAVLRGKLSSIGLKCKTGRTALHYVCQGGSVSLVQTLIREHKTDVNARDDENNAPLNVAAFSGKAEVALSLINEFGCDPNVRGQVGRSVLHNACQGGSVSLVQTLIREHKADVNAPDDEMNTPLIVAAFSGMPDIALSLINEFGCDPNVRGRFGRSVLNAACQGGSVSLVQTLIREHKADVNARDDQNNTPLNAAASCGTDIALSLINEFGCDPNVRGQFGWTVLHSACQGGSVSLIQTLIGMHNLVDAIKGKGNSHAFAMSSLLDFSYRGETPLHICARFGHAACAEALLSANAPLLIRDNNGKTPVDVSKGKARVVLLQYLKENRHKLHIDYNVVLRAAQRRYSGEHPITRLFVLGNPGAGKSSLVESFKTDGILRGFLGIRESSVLPHTAGIVPSTYISEQLGRVLLYDFAGDPEYYSSHAAILENLSASETGKNLIVIVVDLTHKEINIINTVHYWVSFIQCQKLAALSSCFIFVGSHLDSLKSQIAMKREVLANFAELYDGEYYMIDCRKPRSLNGLERKISSLVSSSQQYKLSNEASLLLGLLEKDFGNVTACSLQTVLSHIRDCGVCLPTDAVGLYLILSELHSIGVLLLLGDHTKGNYHVVLQSSKLTNEVHKLLFCKSAVENLQRRYNATFDIGILPESVLKEILPPYITTQCLSCLQYCQEIGREEIGNFIPVTLTNQSFFFFPALCKKDRSEIAWVMPTNDGYSIAWLARCTDPYEFFPPRFLHVLLLRLVFRFTLSAHQTPSTSLEHSDLQCFCTMWKTGIHWLMSEGVECTVELVNGSKGVLIITKTKADWQEICADIFRRITSCVMEAKAEFCQTIKPQYCLLDSTDEADLLNEDNLFAMKKVEFALTHPEVNVIPSVTGKKVMERSRLVYLRKLTLWDSFFPMEFVSVLRYLKPLVTEVYELGLELKVPVHCLETISSDFPSDTSRRRRELVRVWLSSSLDPPCWWHLVRALRSELVGRKDLATNIKTDFSKLHLIERSMCVIILVNLSL